MRRLLLAADRLIVRSLLSVAMVLLGVAAIVGFYQVLARFVLEQPSTWSEVLVRTLIVWTVFLGLGAALRSGSMIAFDFLYRSVGTRLRPWLDVVIGVATLIVLGVMLWYGLQLTLRVRPQVLAGLDVSIAWAYAAIPVGAAAGIVGVLARWADPARPDELEP